MHYCTLILTSASTPSAYLRYSFERDAGLRIDHFLLNDKARARLFPAVVDRRPRGFEKASDHAPFVELADKPQAPKEGLMVRTH